MYTSRTRLIEQYILVYCCCICINLVRLLQYSNKFRWSSHNFNGTLTKLFKSKYFAWANDTDIISLAADFVLKRDTQVLRDASCFRATLSAKDLLVHSRDRKGTKISSYVLPGDRERRYRTAVLSDLCAQSCRWKDLLYGSSDSGREDSFSVAGRNRESRPAICLESCARESNWHVILCTVLELTVRSRKSNCAISYISRKHREQITYIRIFYVFAWNAS